MRPFRLWDDLRASRMTADAWRNLCSEMGIADLPLAGADAQERLNELTATPLGSDVFPGIWWDAVAPNGPNGISLVYLGWAQKKSLGEADASQAARIGFETFSFQTVRWVTLLFFPVFPLGTYRIVRPKDRKAGPWLRQRVDWDWWQVARHWAVAFAVATTIILALFHAVE